jgi:hypothetical protein
MRAVALISVVLLLACHRTDAGQDAGALQQQSDADMTKGTTAALPPVTPLTADAGPLPTEPLDATSDFPLVRGTTEDLLTVAGLPSTNLGRSLFAPSPGHWNDGNPAVAHHDISRRSCLEGLRNVTLQSQTQREQCGAENMVPIYKGGDASSAKTCIDIFEFPNKACELPMVWGSPSQASAVCSAQGKRLCTQAEWNLACAGDPEGGKDRVYAYGDTLDYEICNTSKPHEMGDPTPWGTRLWKCSVQSADTAWKTCGTDTEPAGAFPRCRSRFGVFDQHGNVAEMMSRKEGDVLYTQLKGSAFFYVDVGRSHDAPNAPKMSGGQLHDTYPDQCSFDPRWHVEELARGMHSNYHLGFRCCKGL